MAKSCKIPKLSGTLTNAQWMNGQTAAVEICERRGVAMHRICCSTKLTYIVSVRDEIIRLLDGWGWSTPQIGALLSKNHSSIVIARQRMKGRDPRRPNRPDVVHLGNECETERQGGGGRGVDGGGVRDGGCDLGGPGESHPTREDRERAGTGHIRLYPRTKR